MSDTRLFRRTRNGEPHGPWYAWGYTARGERWQESTGQLTKKAAEAVARELERRHADPAGAAAQEATVASAIGALISQRETDARTGHRSPATAKMYRGHAGHLVRVFGDALRLADLTPARVDDYLALRREEGASEHTLHKELVVLRLSLKLAARRGLWNGNLTALLPAHSACYTPRTRWLTVPEVQRLLAELPSVGAAFVATCIATGGRLSEVVSLLKADVRAEGWVRLRGTKTEGSDRTVPVVLPELRGLLLHAIDLAAGTGGRFLAPWSNPGRSLRRACRRAGLAPCSFNDLRRTHGTWLRRSGAAPHLIGAVLGHSTSKMAETVYGRLDPGALATLLGAANVQQTAWTEAHSLDGLDAMDAENICASAGGGEPSGDRTLDPQIKRQQDRRRQGAVTTVGTVVPVWPKPRRAANMQQRRARKGAVPK